MTFPQITTMARRARAGDKEPQSNAVETQESLDLDPHHVDLVHHLANNVSFYQSSCQHVQQLLAAKGSKTLTKLAERLFKHAQETITPQLAALETCNAHQQLLEVVFQAVLHTKRHVRRSLIKVQQATNLQRM